MKIAVIGGTGLQTMPDARHILTHNIETQYSDFPVLIEEVEAGHVQFFFLARHGVQQQIPPHRINYRANISALSQLGIEAILAVTAVGGVKQEFGTGDLVVPDQIIDYTWGRESTFFDGVGLDGVAIDGVALDRIVKRGRRHIDFTYPYTDSLRTSLLVAGTSAISRTVHDGGVYACTQGPRLETAAEVQRLKSAGVDVIGMTGMPEAALARELDINYASLSVVVNPAAGLSGIELSEQEIEEECRLAAADISTLLVSAIEVLQT